MKHFALLILFTLLTQFLFGQTVNDTIVSKTYIDSLKKEIAELRDKNNGLYWRNRLKSDIVKIDTVFIRPDSVDIIHYVKSYIDESLIVLMIKSVSNFSKGKVTDYIEHFYDYKKQLRYVEFWNAINDEKFVARLYKKERLEYDNSSRLKLHVTYLSSERRTITKTIWYDSLGNANSRTETKKGYSMWDE